MLLLRQNSIVCMRLLSTTSTHMTLYNLIVFRFARIYLECDTSETGTPKWDVKGDSAGVILHYVRRHKINNNPRIPSTQPQVHATWDILAQ